MGKKKSDTVLLCDCSGNHDIKRLWQMFKGLHQGHRMARIAWGSEPSAIDHLPCLCMPTLLIPNEMLTAVLDSNETEGIRQHAFFFLYAMNHALYRTLT